MATTVAEVYSNVQRLLIETDNGGTSWSSGLWSTSETDSYLNEAHRQLLSETAAILSRDTSVVVVPGVVVHALPQAVLAITSVMFLTKEDQFLELARADFQQVDLLDEYWRTPPAGAVPWGYTVGALPSNQIGLMPTSSLAGTLEILYVPRPSDLAQADSFSLPEDLVPAVQWDLLGSMMEKLVGGSESPERAQYARLRAAEWKAAINLLLIGGA